MNCFEPKRNGVQNASEYTLDVRDPAASAFHAGHRTERMRAEGRRIEQPLGSVLNTFSPLSWARPSNLQVVLNDLKRHGHTQRHLRYGLVDTGMAIKKAADMEHQVGAIEHPAKSAAIDALGRMRQGCDAFAALREIPSNAPVTDWSVSYYGRPSTDALDLAWSLLKTSPAQANASEFMGTHFIIQALEAVIANAPGTWRVKVEPVQAAMLIRGEEKEIVVRDGLEVTSAEVQRLVVHEVGGHLTRTLNAERSDGALASIHLGRDNTLTEEGLAVWWEKQFSVDQHRTMQRYAARAIAVDIALHSSVSAIMDALTPWIGAPEAAIIAMRVKRGMSDPERPGAFTKDHAYLSGYLAVENYLSEHPGSIPTIMATKWGLSLAPVAEQLISDGVLQSGRMPWEVFKEFHQVA